MSVYAEYGVGHAWIVDPGDHSLEAFSLNDGAWQRTARFEGDDTVSVPPFEAAGFMIADLWC
jgi:Uma2 family endonuclease